MGLYVLDTDVLTLLREGHPLVCQRVSSHATNAIAVTVISVEEQLSGWYTRLRRVRDDEELARVYQHLADTVQAVAGRPILSFTPPAIDAYRQLVARKLNVAKTDLRIAAIALANRAILVTRKVRDFQRIPGLAIENWAE